MQPIDDIQLRSPEFQEIIGRTPNWLMRSGIGMIFMLIILFIMALSFIRYPEKVEGRAVLTTNIPPLSVLAQSTGRIQLLIDESKFVHSGEALAYIENSARVDQVIGLEDTLKKLNLGIFNNPQGLLRLIHYDLQLGELQGSYLLLCNNINRYASYTRVGSMTERANAIRREIALLESSSEKLRSQLELTMQGNSLIHKRFISDSFLVRDKVIAPNEFDMSQRNVLESQKVLDNIHVSIFSNGMQIMQQNAEMKELEKRDYIDRQEMEQNIMTAIRQLCSEIDSWKKRYLLIAPHDGFVSFSTILNNNQFINTNQEVFKVTSIDSSIIVNSYIPVTNSSKVEVGMLVNIMLDNYPYQEYGMLMGKVNSISLVPVNGYYNIKILLNNGLNTTFRRKVGFKEEMQGTADIITKNLSVMDRLLFKTREILKI